MADFIGMKPSVASSVEGEPIGRAFVGDIIRFIV
jgi:hypothetical protein